MGLEEKAQAPNTVSVSEYKTMTDIEPFDFES